jgi:adenosylcobinamide-GDP ribazoletransferase
VKSLLAAVAFLTRLPVGRLVSIDSADVARSGGWFPLAGLLLGALYAAAAWLFKDHLPLTVAGILLVIVDALATGALHFDGLADAADGFGGGHSREDVLRIMRDHAIGSYGGVALAAVITLKTAAYAALLQHGDWWGALILTPALGRWSILLLTATLPYARQSASVAQGMGKRSLIWGTGVLLAAMGVGMWAGVPVRAWFAMAVVVMVSAAFGLYCRHRIGGITGDTLGANLQLCESAALLTFLWTGY